MLVSQLSCTWWLTHELSLSKPQDLEARREVARNTMQWFRVPPKVVIARKPLLCHVDCMPFLLVAPLTPWCACDDSVDTSPLHWAVYVEHFNKHTLLSLSLNLVRRSTSRVAAWRLL